MNKTYEDTVEILTSKSKSKIKPGLERIQAIMELYGNPQDSFDCIQVAGTNGKGSVCSILASILKYAEFKVGLYTSPHIFDYTERIKINDEEITPRLLTDLVFDITEKAEANGIELTEFEILTAAMFIHFAAQKVDIAIIETGMGGRLDATNIVKSNICSIITHIDLDHTEYLGDTKEKIAYEKAGIIKYLKPVFTNENYEVIKQIAKEKHSPVIVPVESDKNYEFSLKGSYQKENHALALECIRRMFGYVNDNVIQLGLRKVKHPYRFQYSADKNLLVDGAHNPDGARALRESLDEYFPDIPRRYVFGCLKNKDYESMMKTLFRKQDEVYFYDFASPKSASFNELSSKSPVEAKQYKGSSILKPDKLNIICGSLHMISKI